MVLNVHRNYNNAYKGRVKIITVLLLVTASGHRSMQDDLCLGKCGA